MRQIWILSLVMCLAAVSGCCWCKRASEMNCPTDVRKAECWCFGEDALFHCPCGPNEEYYGHKPTCWRAWPTSAEEWRDMRCGPLQQTAIPCGEEPYPPAVGPTLPSAEPDEPHRVPADSSKMAPQQQSETLPSSEGPVEPPLEPAATEEPAGELQQPPAFEQQPPAFEQQQPTFEQQRVPIPETRMKSLRQLPQNPFQNLERQSVQKVEERPLLDFGVGEIHTTWQGPTPAVKQATAFAVQPTSIRPARPPSKPPGKDLAEALSAPVE